MHTLKRAALRTAPFTSSPLSALSLTPRRAQRATKPWGQRNPSPHSTYRQISFVDAESCLRSYLPAKTKQKTHNKWKRCGGGVGDTRQQAAGGGGVSPPRWAPSRAPPGRGGLFFTHFACRETWWLPPGSTVPPTAGQPRFQRLPSRLCCGIRLQPLPPPCLSPTPSPQMQGSTATLSPPSPPRATPRRERARGRPQRAGSPGAVMAAGGRVGEKRGHRGWGGGGARCAGRCPLGAHSGTCGAEHEVQGAVPRCCCCHSEVEPCAMPGGGGGGAASAAGQPIWARGLRRRRGGGRAPGGAREAGAGRDGARWRRRGR